MRNSSRCFWRFFPFALALGSGLFTACSGNESGAGATPADAGLDVQWAGLDGMAGADTTPEVTISADAESNDSDASQTLDVDTSLTPDAAAPDGGSVADAPWTDAETDPDVATSIDAGGSDAADTLIAPSGSPTTVWDLPAISNAATANCQFTNNHTAFEGLTALDAWNVTYTSWEVIGGVPQAILIRGFAARPQGSAKVPGVVQAHGLGGMSKENDATSLAARLGVFVIAYTGPGGGDTPANTSEGLGAGAQNGYHLFDTLTDVRGSWFWGHATAAMRGVTCLATRSDVDAQKLGVTGFSAGGVVSTLLAGHDPRLVASVPLSGTLAWDVATQSPTAWQIPLLQKAGLSTASPEWQKLMAELISPASNFSAASTAHLMAVDGTTDEFFPLSALVPTWNAALDPEKRMSLAANFDHGCYLLTALVESKATIEARAKEHAEGAQVAWFGHYFGTDPAFSYIPLAPVVSVQSGGGASIISAVVDGGGGKLTVDSVHAWVSTDDAFTFIDVPLDKGNGLYSKLIAGEQGPKTVYFVDVIYRTKDLIPRKFSVSSVPVLPAGHVPKIRAVDTCL